MKKCPFCAEEIQQEAIKCRHCGSMVDGSTSLTEPRVPRDEFEDVRDLARAGAKIAAIKLLREQTGWDLAKAKAFVDGIDAVSPVPTTSSQPTSPKGRGIALLAVLVGFLMTFSAATVGAGVLVLWLGLAFALSGSMIVRWLGGLLLALLLAGVGTAMSGRGGTTPAVISNAAPSSSGSTTSRPAVSSRQPEPESNLTRAQRNAARSAQSYLAMSGFSRRGLIGQLSSEYGDQFTVEDATAAVDSLSIDWNAQAVRSAAAYLKMSGFSCQGLINQLSSEYGDKYTDDQATYGATQAGIC